MSDLLSAKGDEITRLSTKVICPTLAVSLDVCLDRCVCVCPQLDVATSSVEAHVAKAASATGEAVLYKKLYEDQLTTAAAQAQEAATRVRALEDQVRDRDVALKDATAKHEQQLESMRYGCVPCAITDVAGNCCVYAFSTGRSTEVRWVRRKQSWTHTGR